jgi:DNA-directed RNA polymerase subunit beta'
MCLWKIQKNPLQIICDRCGVEVTEKSSRDRVGHINLVVPIAHIWYFRSLPNKIGYILGLPSKKLDMIIYYERYVVIKLVLQSMVKVNQ